MQRNLQGYFVFVITTTKYEALELLQKQYPRDSKGDLIHRALAKFVRHNVYGEKVEYLVELADRVEYGKCVAK